LAIIDLFGAYAQDYDACKPGEFLSVFTDTVELAYAQAAEAHVAAHPVWAQGAGRFGTPPQAARASTANKTSSANAQKTIVCDLRVP
jgi:hypothetical protein